MRPSDLARRVNDRFTHCELHPITIMSYVTSTHPLMHHNNAAYNVLCLAQFKQALGVYATSFLSRMDTLGAVMHYAQRAAVTTRVAERLCGGQHAHGQNLVVAVAAYTGYNMEDAVILNRDAVQRGMFNLTLYKTHRYEEEVGTAAEPVAGGGQTATSLVFAHPLDMEARGLPVAGLRPERAAGYAGLQPSGVPAEGAWVQEGDTLLGRVEVRTTTSARTAGNNNEATVTTERTDRSARASRAHTGVVDKVILYPLPPSASSSWGSSSVAVGRVCKIRMRQVRTPALGDKVASRFGQKGVVGMLVPAADMPYCAETGVVPDLIINPHGFPKRMTVTHLLECLLGKAAVLGGARVEANTFEPVDAPNEAGAALRAMGLAASGCEIMHNGRTGTAIDADVFIGINYYGRLTHMAADKYQSRATGRVNALVRQPVKAEGESGGLRVGEMEQNAIMAHGLAGFAKEALMDRSDGHLSLIDAREGVPVRDAACGVPHPHGDARDGLPPRVTQVAWPYAFKLLHQELGALSIDLRLDEVDDVTQVAAATRRRAALDAGAALAAAEDKDEDAIRDPDHPDDQSESDRAEEDAADLEDEGLDAGDAGGEDTGIDGDGGAFS